MVETGQRYEIGRGVAKNPEMAVKYYEMASRGRPEGHYHLGLCYLDGVGVKQSMKKAVENLQAAGEAGHVEALMLLGKIFTSPPRKGKHLEYYNEATAIKYYQQAADMKHIPAMIKVITLLQAGGKSDRAKAKHYIQLLKEQNIKRADKFVNDIELLDENLTDYKPTLKVIVKPEIVQPPKKSSTSSKTTSNSLSKTSSKKVDTPTLQQVTKTIKQLTTNNKPNNTSTERKPSSKKTSSNIHRKIQK